MNKKIVFGMLILVLVCFVGCTTTIDSIGGGIRTPRGSFDNLNIFPAKDYQTLGLVFAEATFEEDDNGVRGDVLTFQMLLKEAQKLGADYIANVVIDFKTEGSKEMMFNAVEKSRQGKQTWFGSATAIKFTDTLIVEGTSTIFDKEGNVVSSSASKNYIRDAPPPSSSPVLGGGGGGGPLSRLLGN